MSRQRESGRQAGRISLAETTMTLREPTHRALLIAGLRRLNKDPERLVLGAVGRIPGSTAGSLPARQAGNSPFRGNRRRPDNQGQTQVFQEYGRPLGTAGKSCPSSGFVKRLRSANGTCSACYMRGNRKRSPEAYERHKQAVTGLARICFAWSRTDQRATSSTRTPRCRGPRCARRSRS
jgi:hypothetical protein